MGHTSRKAGHWPPTLQISGHNFLARRKVSMTINKHEEDPKVIEFLKQIETANTGIDIKEKPLSKIFEDLPTDEAFLAGEDVDLDDFVNGVFKSVDDVAKP